MIKPQCLNATKIIKIGHLLPVFVWSQEEHQNMGAWNYVRPRFENLIGRRVSTDITLSI